MNKFAIILSGLLLSACSTHSNEKNEIGNCLNKIFKTTVEFDLISKDINEEEIIYRIKTKEIMDTTICSKSSENFVCKNSWRALVPINRFRHLFGLPSTDGFKWEQHYEYKISHEDICCTYITYYSSKTDTVIVRIINP